MPGPGMLSSFDQVLENLLLLQGIHGDLQSHFINPEVPFLFGVFFR